MGILTQNLQQINRSIENETSQKITKKESKENFETYLFFEIWQTFARSQDIEKTFLYFKDTATVKKYIEEHQHIKEHNQDGYIKIIDFEALTITEKLTIYNKVLNNIYKQFQYKYKNLNYNTIPEEEEKPKNNILENIANFIIYVFIGFFTSLVIGSHKKRYKF